MNENIIIQVYYFINHTCKLLLDIEHGGIVIKHLCNKLAATL